MGMFTIVERKKMPTMIKVLPACLICTSIAAADVYAAKWLW